MSGLFGGGANAQSAPIALGALNIQQSSYSMPVPIIYGTNRTSGNLIWYSNFQQVLTSTGGTSGKGGVGGGGGKGGGSQQYQYYASLAIGICEGPITGIGKIWVTKNISTLSDEGGYLATGTLAQASWPYLVSNFPDEADGYNNMAYVGFANFSLGTSAETPQFSFEIKGNLIIGNGNQDAYADAVIEDFLMRAAFPSAFVGDFSDIANYWKAMGFFMSPKVDQQRAATDWLKEWMDTLNGEFVWSNGLLTAVPYADATVSGNGVTYTPNLTPNYDLTDDDFLISGDEDPVHIDRQDLADAYNQLPIEYINRADQYNTETYIAEDPAQIDLYGVRVGSTLTAHHITDPNVAQVMAYLSMWRGIYVDKANKYKFKLPWNFIRLDPMDLVTLTDENLGLNRTLVRIKQIDEDEDGTLNFTAEDVPGQIAAPALYSTQGTARYAANYNEEAPAINTPVIFESPLALVQASDVELNLAISGSGPNWGGANVWVSTDGNTYQNIGQINGASRQGVLSALLATFTPGTGGNNIDTAHTLSIDMTESNGALNNSATDADAIALNTLCFVDGEFIAYGNDSLTATNKYDLTYLNRGCYGSTIASHAAGKQFVRYDAAVLRYPIDQSRVGQTLYFKFASFNQFGGGIQGLDEVAAYPYQVLGTALLTPLANPTNLSVNYTSNIGQLNWTGINDIRSPILYEVRKGSSWSASQFVGRTATPTFPVYGQDTYWVSALYLTPLGVAVYSNTPLSIAVAVPTIQNNIIETWDEAATSWFGTLSNCTIVSGNVELNSGQASGSYTVPTGHRIASNYIVSANVAIDWTVVGFSAGDDVVTMPDVTAIPDMVFGADQAFVMAQPQIRFSQDGGSTWGPWINWVPGVYTFNLIDFRMLLSTTNLSVQPILDGFAFSVDSPTIVQDGTATTSTSPVTVPFPQQFNTTPKVQITVVSASAGDQIVLTGENDQQFSVEVLNSGSPVVRTINWMAKGW